jgi:hypothetical protein
MTTMGIRGGDEGRQKRARRGNAEVLDASLEQQAEAGRPGAFR